MIRFLTLARSQPALLARIVIGVFMLLEVLLLAFGPSASAARHEIAEAIANADPSRHWEPYADLGIHYAALINLGLLALLAATAKIWTRPFQSAPEDDPIVRERPALWQRIVLPVAMVIGFSTIYGMTSFASKSLWWDELWALKVCVHGTWKPDKKKPDELKFQPTTWKRCAFYYLKPTNHVPMSLAQKASLSVWRTVTRAKEHEFSNLAVRMPALIASGIAVLLLMRLCGAAQGASLGALLLMVHPWHLRYGVDARSYAFVVPLCISAILACRKIIFQRGRKAGPWIWLALNQALWVWVYPFGALEVGMLFLTLTIFLWRGEENLKDKVTATMRVGVAHLAAGMLTLQVFLPNFMQARLWAGREDQGHAIDASILKDTLSSLATGMSWRTNTTMPEAQGLTGLVNELGSEPLAYAALVFLLGLSLLGLGWALKHQPRTGWLLAAPLVSAVMLALMSAVTGVYYYPRFAVALLPIFVAGLSFTGQLFSFYTQTQRRIVLGVIIIFVIFTNHQRGVLMARPYSGIGNAAEFVINWPSKDKSPLVACFGLGREVFTCYYPKADDPVTVAELEALRTRAQSEGRDLLIVQGHTGFHTDMLPAEMKLLRDPAKFEEVASFPGIDSELLYRVLKAK